MPSSELDAYLEERAGEYHRGTIVYDGSEIDVQYLRSDIAKNLMLSKIDRMHSRLRPESMSKEEHSFPFGHLRATVRSFEAAIILHFPIGENRGVVVSLEPETAQNLNTFIGECTQRIHN